jgi:hypothetical protein
MDRRAAGSNSGTHSATRIVVSPAGSYEELEAAFERTVPILPLEQLQARLKAGDAAGARSLLENGSSVGMYLFFTLDATPFMAAMGHGGKAKTYLMGNPLTAERMYTSDPAVMLYAPLRVLLHEDHQGAAHLTLDRPSDLFGSFGNEAITSVGHDLDATVAKIIQKMGFTGPTALSS